MRTIKIIKRGKHCYRLFSSSQRQYGDASVTQHKAFPDLTTSVHTAEHKLQPTNQQNMRRSLIPNTLKEMEQDSNFKLTLTKLKELGQARLTEAEVNERNKILRLLNIPDFKTFCTEMVGSSIGNLHRKQKVDILQVNIGLYCNQACSHCHVESSPKRTEMMSHEVAEKCLELLACSPSTHTLDITGGAPELCEQFRFLVTSATRLGKTVIDRCNLTALLEPGQEDTAEFLANHKVQISASLPCYSRKNVNMQRGSNVFQRSIEALNQLNNLGYGQDGSGLILDLIYNPLGAYLPPDQTELEQKYKEELQADFGIVFNQLFTITNMPIKRFCDFLVRRGELREYIELLVRNFNGEALRNVMCNNLLSVNYNGFLYDCDFNQQLELPITAATNVNIPATAEGRHIFDITNLNELFGSSINTGSHCFGCTAGRGSS